MRFCGRTGLKMPLAAHYYDHVGEFWYGTVSGRDPKRYSFPGSIQAPIPHFRIAFPGSSRSGVHAHRKYRFKWLFSKNTRFNWILTLQYSGLLLASFFSVYHSRIFGRIGQQMPLAARYRIHVGECGFLGVLSCF